MRWLALAALVGCGGSEGAGEPVSLRFAAEVDGAALACGAPFTGGSSSVSAELIDLRFYVHDVVLIDEDGAEVPAPLDPAGDWQTADVALLDLAGEGGACQATSPEVNDVVALDVPAGTYTGARFTLGVPPDRNHLDSEAAEAPLDELALWWGWRYGYKYLMVELATGPDLDWVFHLGASACVEEVDGDFACTDDNLVTVALDAFDPATDVITLDVGALVSTSALDTTDGCQTGEGDVDCAPLFDALGLDFEGTGGEQGQSVFVAR